MNVSYDDNQLEPPPKGYHFAVLETLCAITREQGIAVQNTFLGLVTRQALRGTRAIAAGAVQTYNFKACACKRRHGYTRIGARTDRFAGKFCFLFPQPPPLRAKDAIERAFRAVTEEVWGVIGVSLDEACVYIYVREPLI